MTSWMQRGFFASLLAVVACSGGGGGCSGCSGVTPLPQGFPVKDRIENVASVRLTDAGIGFINDNLPALISKFASGLLTDGVFKQAIPKTDSQTKVLGINVTINVCEDAPYADMTTCQVEADIGKSTLALTSAAPNALKVGGNLLARVQKVPVRVPIAFGQSAKISVVLSNNDGCNDPPDFATIPVTVTVPITADTNPNHGTRSGLSRVGKLGLDLNINNDNIHVCGNNFGGSILAFFAGFFKSTIVGQLTGPLQDQVNNALCIKGNPAVSPPCPVGSNPKDPNDLASTCVFDDNKDECASFALGTEGTIDLSNALSAFSPTTTGGLDFLFSLGGTTANPNNNNQPLGDLNPIANGATLSLTGGANPNPLATCINPAVLTKPVALPTPKILLGNEVANWPAGSKPHFGLGLSEDFINYSLGGVYNSGLLCLELGSDQIAQLNSGTFSLLVPSLKSLVPAKQNAPVALVLKPTNPPVVTIGNSTDPKTDPTMNVALNGLGIDWYIWSMDRYIRAFKTQFDLGVPVTLSVTADGKLAPQISDLSIKNMQVTDSELLADSAATIGGGIQGVLGAAVGQALGGIKPIDISGALSSLGFTLTIPPAVPGKGSPGLQKLVEKDANNKDRNFLGLFATLGIAPASGQQMQVTTQASVAAKHVDPAGLRITTMTSANGPELSLEVSSSVPDAEYSVQVDNGYWRPWTQATTLSVRDDALRLQGRHHVQVKSRAFGQAPTESEPVRLDLTMDVDAPMTKLTRKGASVEVTAVDHVADDAELTVRFSVDGKPAGEWLPYHEGMTLDVGDRASVVAVEVRDSEGNVAHEQLGETSEALRGRIDTTGQAAAAGCGCSVPGQSNQVPGAGALAALAMAGMVARLRARRRRVREAAVASAVMAVAGSWSGCNCGSDGNGTDITNEGGSGGSGGGAGTGGTGGAAGTAGTGGAAGTAPSNPCDANPDCVKLNPGIVGSYTSAAVAKDGTLWVAGYNEQDFDEDYPYGDLVVGAYDAAKNAVAWKTVDGTDPDEDVDPTQSDAQGWRGGKLDPGPDVGTWTSIAVSDDGKPMVAYYDITNGALKFASYDGTKWSSHTVQKKTKSRIGRYAKMTLIGGKPVVAYHFHEPSTGGATVSGVRVARAKTATPASDSDWAFDADVVSAPTPCVAALCDGGAKCNVTSGKCETPGTTCSPACTTGTQCFTSDSGLKCQPAAASSPIESYPDTTGLYVSTSLNAAKTDIGIAYYDRQRGDLYIAQKGSSGWTTTLVDGQQGPAPGTDTGDVGIGTSLLIDDKGDWHLTYVNGLTETLRYLKLTGGAVTPGLASEQVDDGSPVASQGPSSDRSVIGDDSNLRLQGSDLVVTYQDATNGVLRVAHRPVAGGAWKRAEVKQDGKFAGYFSQQVTLSSRKVVSFWRTGGEKVVGNVSVLDVP